MSCRTDLLIAVLPIIEAKKRIKLLVFESRIEEYVTCFRPRLYVPCKLERQNNVLPII